MKMIKPGFTIYEIPDAQNHDEVLMHIEKIGRVCYKSEDKITIGSANKFLESIRNRKHWAVLEHYIFVLSVPEEIYRNFEYLNDIANIYSDSEYILKSSFLHRTEWLNPNINRWEYLVSFSATTLNYLVNCDTIKDDLDNGILLLYKFMKNLYPEIIVDIDFDTYLPIDSGIRLLSRSEIRALPKWLRDIHDSMSVLFTVDRGISHEIVRHRPASFAQESTRYCNYSNGKFNSEITVIIPSFFDTGIGEMSNSFVFDEWRCSCEVAERAYFKLLEYKATPQQARSVLPNSLKADIVMTATIHEWKHFFDMRCDIAAHPQMREVTCPLLTEANTKNDYYKDLFNNQIKFIKEN